MSRERETARAHRGNLFRNYWFSMGYQFAISDQLIGANCVRASEYQIAAPDMPIIIRYRPTRLR